MIIFLAYNFAQFVVIPYDTTTHNAPLDALARRDGLDVEHRLRGNRLTPPAFRRPLKPYGAQSPRLVGASGILIPTKTFAQIILEPAAPQTV